MADDDDEEDDDVSASPDMQVADAGQPADDWSKFPLVQQAGAQGGQDDWSKFPLVNQQQQQPKAESPFWTTLRHVAHGLLPSAAGLAAIPGGIAAGAAIGLPEAGIGAIPGAFIGGGLAYMGARAAQDTGAKLMGFGDDLQMAADDAANPKAAVVGDILSAAPFLGPGAAPAAVRAGGALFGAGMEAFNQWKSGEDFDPARLAIAGAGGAFLTTPTRAGEAIGSRAAAAIGRPELWHGTPGSDAAAGTAKEQPPPAGGTPGEGGAAAATPEATAPAGDRGGAEDYGKAREPPAEPAPAEQGATNTDPALDAAIRAKMEPDQTTVEVNGQARPDLAAQAIQAGEAARAAAPEPRITLEQAHPGNPNVTPLWQAYDDAGNVVATMRATITGDTARIHNIYAGTKNPALYEGAEQAALLRQQRGALGPTVVREMLRQFREQNPQVQRIEGERVSGARAQGGYGVEGTGPEAGVGPGDGVPSGQPPRERVSGAPPPEQAPATPAAPSVAAEQQASEPSATPKPTAAPSGGIGNIIEQTGPYSIRRAGKGFEVYEDGPTASTRVARIGYSGDKGLERARQEVARRMPAPEATAPATPREAIAQRAPDETVTSEPSTDPLQQRVNEAADVPNTAAHLRETAAMYREQGQEGSARRLEQGADAIERSQQQQQQRQRQRPAAAPGGPPKPPTVGQAAAAAGGALPPGPTSMAYAPPQNRSNLSNLWRSMKLLVGSDIGPYGRQAENIIRGAYGRAKRVFEQTMNLLNPHMETVRNMGPMDRAALNNRVEGGNDFPNWQPTPDQQRIIDVYKPAMDLWKDQFSKLDRTAQMKFVNDYLAHMYKNPAQASEFFSQFGKRGGAGSTKGRTHATYEDAKKAGLEPLTDNPIEIATRYGLSMTNFLASNDALERAVETGVVGYFNSGKSVGATGSPEPHQVGGPPPGWKKLNAPSKGPFLEAYAPEDFADKYNAFYSHGLRGVHAPIYDALRSANAGWTMMELGLNAYHFFTMANEAIISDVKRGLDQIFTGQIKEGAKTIAGAPLAPGTRYIEGKRFQREYLDPNSTNPIASIMAEANARPIGRGHAYDILGSTGDENISRGSFIKNFDKDKINSQLKQAWDDVKDDWGLADSVGKQALFPFKQASRVLQTVGAPLFDKYIPALKAGAMHSQMADWLARNPRVDINTPAGRQAAVEMAMKISDGVDNAFGEMVHDNLFINQALRHAAMVAMRSFSWSIGAMRQIGGGTYAAGKAGVLSLKTGENRFSMAHPEFDPRISYAIAFPFVVATISAIYQGLRAGEAPQDWRDLYAPRTGGTVPGLGGRGQVPEHALMPGFQKDVYGWLSHPGREAYAKLGGLPTTAIEQITNRDWRGDPIAQRGASPIDQFQQRMAHLFSKLGPIGARAIAKGQPETSGITPVETALGFRAPGVDIQDPQRLEKWMAASAKKEWKAKERHDKTEQRKYARERTYDPQEREQQPQ